MTVTSIYELSPTEYIWKKLDTGDLSRCENGKTRMSKMLIMKSILVRIITCFFCFMLHIYIHVYTRAQKKNIRIFLKVSNCCYIIAL